MNKKKEFESLLANIANTPSGFAGGGNSSKRSAKHKSHSRARADVSVLDSEISEELVLKELRRAKQRQRRDPSLFSGDPEGFFTYDDPVLAITAYLYQSHKLMSAALGMAGDRGETLQNESLLRWAKTAIHMWLSRKDKGYLTLMGMTPQKSIKFEGDILRIAVVGDAGFECHAQKQVIDKIRRRHLDQNFDLLIHLGDIYFSGNRGEMLRNFLAPFRNAGPRVFSLVGNHDLYFGGDPFINVLEDLKQPGRYFIVENKHWRVACLDTAVPAQSVRRNTGRLDKGQLAWLQDQLEIKDGKETILMSHHFVVSAWAKSSATLKRQLNQQIERIFSWYWGHEHGCATYEKKSAGFNGACVGNGAFLEVWNAPTRQPQPTWYSKKRCHCYKSDSKFWPHGYLELELRPDKAIEIFHLEDECFSRTLPRRKSKSSNSKPITPTVIPSRVRKTCR